MDVFDHYAMALRLAHKAGCETQDAVDEWMGIGYDITYEERVTGILGAVTSYVANARQNMEVHAVLLHELQFGAEELLQAMNGRDE